MTVQYANDRFAPILLKKSLGGRERNFLGLLTPIMRCDVRDHVASQKTIMELRIDAAKHRSRVVPKNQHLRKFLASLDFRLFQDDQPEAVAPPKSVFDLERASRRLTSNVATNSNPHDGTLPNNVRDQRRIGSAYGWRASQGKY